MKYSLVCYSTRIYKSAEESIKKGGNWFIANFEEANLTIEHFRDDNSIVRNLQQTANNAMDVFGHTEDVCYFVTVEDGNNVLFYEFQSDDGRIIEWVERNPVQKDQSVYDVEVTCHIRIKKTIQFLSSLVSGCGEVGISPAELALKLAPHHFPQELGNLGEIEFTVE